MDSDVTVRCASFLPPSALDAWLAVDAESRQKVASWMIHSEFIALGNRAEDLSTLRTGFIARVIPSLAGDADDMYKGVELPPWTLDHLAVRMCEWEEYCTPIDMRRWAELFARGFGCSWRVTLWSRRYGPVAYWISKCVAQCCQRRGPPVEEEGSIQVSNVGQAVTASLGGNPWIDDSMPIPDLVVSHDFHETIVHRCATLAEAGSIILERALVATEVGDPQHCLNAPNDATMLDDMLLSFDSRPRCSRNHLVEYFDIEGRTTMIKSANLRGMTVKKVADAKVNYSIDVLRMRDWEIGFTDEPLLGHFIRMLADRYRLSKLDLRMSRGSGNMGMFRNMPSLAHVRTPFIAQELSDEAFSLFADLVSVNFSYSIELTEIHGFRQNPKLRTIRFPGALRRIASHAFSDCASLRRVDLSACPFLEYVDGFNFCSSLIQITLPPSMIEIGANGFAACSSLSTLDLTMCPRLRRIDGFGDCSRLVSLQLPPSVAFIGPTAFHRCVALTRVDLTKCSPDLEVQGFAECDGLARLSVLPRTNLAQAGVSGRYDNVFIERLPETKAASPQPHPPARTLLAVVP